METGGGGSLELRVVSVELRVLNGERAGADGRGDCKWKNFADPYVR